LALLVPADLGADPLPAARALVKLRLDLLDRVLERVVPGLAAQAVFGVFGRVAGVPQVAATEQATETFRDLRADAEHAGLEARAVTVPALIAVEFELVPRVVAVIGVVPGKRDTAHGGPTVAKRPAESQGALRSGCANGITGACVDCR